MSVSHISCGGPNTGLLLSAATHTHTHTQLLFYKSVWTHVSVWVQASDNSSSSCAKSSRIHLGRETSQGTVSVFVRLFSYLCVALPHLIGRRNKTSDDVQCFSPPIFSIQVTLFWKNTKPMKLTVTKDLSIFSQELKRMPHMTNFCTTVRLFYSVHIIHMLDSSMHCSHYCKILTITELYIFIFSPFKDIFHSFFVCVGIQHIFMLLLLLFTSSWPTDFDGC